TFLQILLIPASPCLATARVPQALNLSINLGPNRTVSTRGGSRADHDLGRPQQPVMQQVTFGRLVNDLALGSRRGGLSHGLVQMGVEVLLLGLDGFYAPLLESSLKLPA